MKKLSRVTLQSSLVLALTAIGTGVAQAQVAAPPPAGADVADSEAAPQELLVQLVAAEGGEGSGEATLRGSADGQVEATFQVTELPASTAWSAFLVAGTCAAPEAVIQSLGDVEVGEDGQGTGAAAISAPLSELTAGPATVQIHPQGEAPAQALLCGELAPGSAR